MTREKNRKEKTDNLNSSEFLLFYEMRGRQVFVDCFLQSWGDKVSGIDVQHVQTKPNLIDHVLDKCFLQSPDTAYPVLRALPRERR